MLIPDHHVLKPRTETEWLMMPYEEQPDLSESHIDDVAAAIDALTPKERMLVNAIYFERTTYEELGKRIGHSKVHAWRLTWQALKRLRHLIESEGSLMAETWDQAAWDVVRQYDRTMPKAAAVDLIAFCARRMSESVRNLIEPQSLLFSTMAVEVIGELKDRGIWSADDFHQLLCDKQRDYGRESINAFGLTGIAVRLNDKVARLQNLLAKKASPSNEPQIDTWVDILGYCVVAEMFGNGTFQLPLTPTPKEAA